MAVHVGFVGGKVVFGQVFHRVLRFSRVILPVFHTHLYVALTGTKGE